MQLIQFLANRGTQLVKIGVDNSGRNWYMWSRHLGKQVIQFLDRRTQLVLSPLPYAPQTIATEPYFKYLKMEAAGSPKC